MFKILLLLSITSMTGYSAVPKGAIDLCKIENINKYSQEKIPVKNHLKEIKSLGNVYFAENKSDCASLKTRLEDKKSTIVLDARGKGSRGSINGAIKLVSDHDESSSHQFKEGIFEDYLTKYLEKKRSIKNANLKDLDIAIFCNGPTCYRTIWAACSLNKIGYDPKKLHLYLDGYFGIKKSCLN